MRHPVPLTNTSDDCRPASGAIFSLSEGISVQKKHVLWAAAGAIFSSLSEGISKAKTKKDDQNADKARRRREKMNFLKAFLGRKLKNVLRPAAGAIFFHFLKAF